MNIIGLRLRKVSIGWGTGLVPSDKKWVNELLSLPGCFAHIKVHVRHVIIIHTVKSLSIPTDTIDRSHITLRKRDSKINTKQWGYPLNWSVIEDGNSASVCSIHYDDVIMTMLASQITSLTVVYSIVYSGVNQRKHQSSASLAFVREIHRGPVNFPHKWPVTRKMFPFDDVIMIYHHDICVQTGRKNNCSGCVIRYFQIYYNERNRCHIFNAHAAECNAHTLVVAVMAWHRHMY